MEMKTYPEMNARIKEILTLSGSPTDLCAAKRIEELEQKNEKLVQTMAQVQAEVDEFMALLEITFESHPGVVEKASAFNDFIRRGQRYKAALEEVAISCPDCVGTGKVALGNHPIYQQVCERCEKVRKALGI